MGKKPCNFYAVRKGFAPGIYNSWDACKLQVNGFSGSEYQGFATRPEAEAWLSAGNPPPQQWQPQQPPQWQQQQQPPQQQQFGASHYSAQQEPELFPVYDPQRGMTEWVDSTGRVQGLSEGAPGQYRAIQRSSQNLRIFRGPPDDPEELQARAAMVPSARNPTSAAPLYSGMERNVQRLPAAAGGPSSSTASVAPSPGTPLGFYTLEFDGASKGNPGPAGAGALICDPSGAVVQRVTIGLGRATNNVAEYRALIAGLRAAVEMGVRHLIVQGDSELVCNQLKGIYKVRNEGLIPLWEEAGWLMSLFANCSINHVERRYNSRADELANRALDLPEEKFVSSISI